MADWVDQKACIVVKTYPTPAWNGVEVVCTAAITEEGKWLRLFPVPFRFLDQDKRFKKYQWVQLRVKKATDFRTESFNIDPDSIKLLNDEPITTKNKWQERKNVVFPLLAPSYCSLKEQRDAAGSPTLGIFKPKRIIKLVIESGNAEWDEAEQAKLTQGDLFDVGPIKELEKIPFKFSYHFECNVQGCGTHTFMCTDWEMAQAYRMWRRKYGNDWEKYFRQKFEQEMMQKDTHFYVGTVHQHPANWIIVGLFYPPL